MTYDELLARIESFNKVTTEGMERRAIRAVVQLHKPDKEGLCDMNCVDVDDDGYAWTQVAYPCQTIQAMLKELGCM